MKVPIKLFTASLVLAVCITLMSGCLNIAGNEQQSTSDIPTQISTRIHEKITEQTARQKASLTAYSNYHNTCCFHNIITSLSLNDSTKGTK